MSEKNMERSHFIQKLPATMTIAQMIEATQREGYKCNYAIVYSARTNNKLGYAKGNGIAVPAPKQVTLQAVPAQAPAATAVVRRLIVEPHPETKKEIRSVVLRFGTQAVQEVIDELVAN